MTDENVCVNVLGEAHGGFGDGIVVGVVAARQSRQGLHRGVVLDVEDNFLEFAHGLERIFAVGGFVREHDDVGALNDGVRDIAHLGARGDGAVDHGAHGLGGHDAELGVLTAKFNQFALDDGDDFGADFVGHVATSHHDGVAGLDDLFEVLVGFDGLFGFDFGDDFGLRAFLAQEFAKLMNVVSTLDKGERDIVKVAGGAPFEIGEVFRSKNVAAEVSIGEIEALVAHEETVVLGDKFDGGIGDDLHDVGADFAVEQVDGLADFDLGGKVILDGESEAAVVFLDGVIENEGVAFVDIKVVIFEVAEADFGALQILQNGD